MENVFLALKRNEISPSLNMLDLLHQTVDYTSKLAAGEDLSSSERSRMRELIDELENTAQRHGHRVPDKEKGNEVKPDTPIFTRALPAPVSMGALRVSSAKLDALLLQAEEMVSIKLATGQRTQELKDLKIVFDLWKKEWTKNTSTRSQNGQGINGETKRKERTDSSIASFEAALTRLIKQLSMTSGRLDCWLTRCLMI